MSKKKRAPPAAAVEGCPRYRLLYRTFSICPTCCFVERRPMEWIPSVGLIREQKVWYVYTCPRHGQREVLVFSNANYFMKRVAPFSPGVIEPKTPGVNDVEELNARMQFKSKILNRPLTLKIVMQQRDSPGKLRRDVYRALVAGTICDPETVFPGDVGVVELPSDDGPKKPPEVTLRGRIPKSRLERLAKLRRGEPLEEEEEGETAPPAAAAASAATSADPHKPIEFTDDVLLKLDGTRVNPVSELNARVHYVLESTNEKVFKSPPSILLELPFTKFSEIFHCDSTCLLSKRVYPFVKIYIEKGREYVNVQELTSLFRVLSRVHNIRVVLNIVIQRPLASLREILALVRQQTELCQYVVIQFERTPRQIKSFFGRKLLDVPPKKSNRNSNSKNKIEAAEDDVVGEDEDEDSKDEDDDSNSDEDEYLPELRSHFVGADEDNMDLYELLMHIRDCTDSEIVENDFFPLSAGLMGEEFLSFFGLGRFCIRPSPLCGMGTILMNVGTKHVSVPISRFSDIGRLFREFVPLMKSQSAFDKLTLGFFKARKVRKLLRQTTRGGMGVPSDILSYIAGDDLSKQLKAKKVFDSAQILIVHMTMDVACADIGRRGRCSCLTYRDGKLYSECMMCI